MCIGHLLFTDNVMHNSAVVVLWKSTSWHRVILGGANSCVALLVQLGQMQTIADPRGGNVRGLFSTHSVFKCTVRGQCYQRSVRCQTRTQIISPSQFVSIKLEKKQAIHFSFKIRLSKNVCFPMIPMNAKPFDNVEIFQ